MKINYYGRNGQKDGSVLINNYFMSTKCAEILGKLIAMYHSLTGRDLERYSHNE